MPKTVEVPWTVRRSNLSILKEINPELFVGRTDTEVPILWPPDVKSGLVGEEPHAEKGGGQEKGPTEDETVRWHLRPSGHEFEQTLGDKEGQESHSPCPAVHGVTKSWM